MPRTVGVKAKIDRAAVELFAARGVDGVSIADIAAAAGVSQGALYRHYRSKDELASRLFSTAFLRTGAELDAIRTAGPNFATRIGAMVEHFCRLYDMDAPLFRFMLIAQHDLLPRISNGGRSPAAVIEDAVADAVAAREIAPIDPAAAAAAIMGVVLQTAIFHLYGRLCGPLLPRAPSLARAAVAAAAALA
jgi:AcrR family transcriptional regulator